MAATKLAWDPSKAESNARKHKVTFEEAATVFDDPHVLLEEDRGSSEERFAAIGYSSRSRVLFVVFVERAGQVLRIISARKVTSHERKRYEKGR